MGAGDGGLGCLPLGSLASANISRRLLGLFTESGSAVGVLLANGLAIGQVLGAIDNGDERADDGAVDREVGEYTGGMGSAREVRSGGRCHDGEGNGVERYWLLSLSVWPQSHGIVESSLHRWLTRWKTAGSGFVYFDIGCCEMAGLHVWTNAFETERYRDVKKKRGNKKMRLQACQADNGSMQESRKQRMPAEETG